ncbi:MAG: DUF6378 domain-containing protein [Erysipelotrichaceae bacterium]
MNNVSETLKIRGSRYGEYSDVSKVTQDLMGVIYRSKSFGCLNDCQKTSLFMICNKIARTVSGDPNYQDNWHDIAGYATLAERECNDV